VEDVILKKATSWRKERNAGRKEGPIHLPNGTKDRIQGHARKGDDIFEENLPYLISRGALEKGERRALPGLQAARERPT